MLFYINIISCVFLISCICTLCVVQLNAEYENLSSNAMQHATIAKGDNLETNYQQSSSSSHYKRSKYAKYTVYVETNNTQLYAYYGAGVIINKRIVLTTASVLQRHLDFTQKDKPELPKRVVAGLSSPEMVPSYNQYRNVKIAVPHPAYHEVKAPYVIDIGIIYLDNDLKIHTGEAGVALLPKQIPTSQDNCVVVSWIEVTYKGALKVHKLMERDVSIIEWQECKRDMPELFSEALCIVDAKTSMRPCNITNGSPVFCNDVLVGIVGHWPHCNNITKYPLHHPRICSSVYYFIDWIASTRLDLKALASKSKSISIISFLLIILLFHFSFNLQTNF